MRTSRTGIVVRTSWTAYLIKAYAVVLALFALRHLMSSGVSSAAALVGACVLISLPVTLAGARLLVFRKRLKGTHVVPESLRGKLIAKKTLGLVVCVVVGLVSALTLVSALPLWTSGEWVTALVTILIFWPVSLLADAIAGPTYYQPQLEIVATPWRLGLTVGTVFLLLLLYGFLPFAAPADVDFAYLSALNNARNGLTDSTSLLVSDVAHLGSQFAAVREFALDMARSGPLRPVALVASAVQAAMIGVSVAGLLEFCRLPTRSLRTILDPIWLSSADEFAAHGVGRRPVRKREIAVIGTAYGVAIALALVGERAYSQNGGFQAAVRAAQSWITSLV